MVCLSCIVVQEAQATQQSSEGTREEDESGVCLVGLCGPTTRREGKQRGEQALYKVTLEGGRRIRRRESGRRTSEALISFEDRKGSVCDGEGGKKERERSGTARV